MEIIKSKTGDDRSILRVNYKKIRVVGESDRIKKKINKRGELVVYDYQDGPFFNVGGFVSFEKMKYRIKSILELKSHPKLKEIVLEVTPQY
jgi:hypothetical protein